MKAIELTDALVEHYKKEAPEYPEYAALGALKAKFSSFLWYVGDLLDAIEKHPDDTEYYAKGVRNFINRLEEEAKA